MHLDDRSPPCHVERSETSHIGRGAGKKWNSRLFVRSFAALRMTELLDVA